MRKILAIAMMMAMMLTAYPMMPANQAHAASTKAPAKVAGLRATTASTTAIKLSWKAVTKASGYTVYRNGYAVASTKSTSFVDTGLRANSVYTYKVKAYKNYKQKQYYNKKTKKWQTKKPAKKYRGKTRKVVKHKYGKASVQATARTANNPSTPSIPSTPSTPSIPSDDDDEFEHISTPPVAGGNEPFPVDDKVTLTYSANNSSTKTTIYLGQTWTSTVKENLKRGSSGFATYTRNKFYMSRTVANNAKYDGTVYLFDIGDYDNFLKVEVANGQIVGWQTTAAVMGESHGLAITRGKNVSYSPLNDTTKYVWKDFYQTNATKSVLGLGYPVGGMIIGGVESYNTIDDNSVLNMGGLRSNEKMIGFHYINAARVLCGRNKLAYDNYLDGGSRTVTTTSPINLQVSTLESDYEVNLAPGTYRYGAQPTAETISANRPKISHYFDRDGLTKGPHGGWNKAMRFEIVKVASNNTITNVTEVLYGVDGDMPICFGEEFLCGYKASAPHLEVLFSNYTKIGLGAHKGALCNMLGK